ncbi:hypothetical protein DSO57_1038768 [Entomophthora muscae]|uniref:Uncharacterized protein n=1 Tax=Entomophthora muscae TaxID=34485 RepID=A0ACC2SBQ4_9FUNG|nr:hypothetical protein DSO57_1038768 [Entomophthora muscae]
MEKLDFLGKHFFNTSSGRVAQFRGINFGGDSKLPVGWTTDDKETVFNLEDISYVGKPVPLNAADEHCKRLRYWGFSFVRLVAPWEALEHKGPGIYDEEYIEYLIKLLKIFRKYGIRCFIDPHQDCWSRLCGGSGAPNWTLYLAGLDPRKFSATGAANTHFDHIPPEEYPNMMWSTNYAKLAAATMFTLFFGGETFAPKCTIESKPGEKENIQTFLQRTYCEAYQHLFACLKKEDLLDSVVVGIDTLNEPSEGFIETEDISSLSSLSLTATRNGACPTVLQTFILGEGNSSKVDRYGSGTLGFLKQGTMTISPNGVKAWFKEGESTRPNLNFPPWQEWQTSGSCIWAWHGIWDPATLKAKQSNYFSFNPKTQRNYEFLTDFWKPFVKRLTLAIRGVNEDSIIFIDPPVNFKPPSFKDEEALSKRMVYCPHWYDGKTLLSLHYAWWNVDYLGYLRKKYWFIGQALRVGENNVRKCFQSMISLIQSEGIEAFGETPCIIGECGIPFNLDSNAAYSDGDYSQQVKALDATLNATEQTGVYCTLWNYTIQNANKDGDFWNREDLSIYCPETKLAENSDYFFRSELDKGGRALEAAVRPYATLVPGLPEVQTFALPHFSKTGAPSFHFCFQHFPKATEEATKECEIFLPIHHFPASKGLNVSISEGSWKLIQKPLYDGAYDEPFLQYVIWEFDTLQPGSLYTIKKLIHS